MPLNIPVTLPAVEALRTENIFVMDSERASTQEIRPLKIVILNLMPIKITTETDLIRLLSNSPLQIEIDFLHMETHCSKNTPIEHLMSFYKTFDEIKKSNYDGMIITGAPVEQMPFEEVAYWPELCEIMEWSKSHVYSTMHICWGAQAGLYYHYGVPKYDLPAKMFGIFPHSRSWTRPVKLFRGLDDVFYVPHSRHTEIRRSDIEKVSDLRILSESEESGVYAVSDMSGRQIFLTGHVEYDPMTLKSEYERDVSRGLSIDLPRNYFHNDDPARPPIMRWRSSAYLLFANWLNYYVYQETPFDLDSIHAEH